VDWVVQVDCPEDGVTYVHRAGRTARYNTAGESLLVLLPQEEEAMLKQLQAHKVPITKIEVSSDNCIPTLYRYTLHRIYK
jgi:ATP-dependent RNA helicase DDX10/DBP4